MIKTREQLELEYLELCDILGREATQFGFEKFRKDPQEQDSMRRKAIQAEQRECPA